MLRKGNRKSEEACQSPWCRQPYAYVVYMRGAASRWRFCQEHAESFQTDLRYIVEKRVEVNQ